MSDAFTQYLRNIERELKLGNATEHTYRPALKTLIETLAPGVMAINEPKRVECGAPDFIITRAGTPIGCMETKDIGISLDAEERSDQMHRYRTALNNLILTDYLEFRWYVQGEHRQTARLATATRDGKTKRSREGVQALTDLLQRFFLEQVATIDRPRDLAQRMACLARMIRTLIEETFKQESAEGTLHAQLKAFRETLIPDLGSTQFADMYAQTIAYGLFAARIRVPNAEDFTREKAAWKLPKTNPFLRRLFNEIAGPDLDHRIAWLVDDLACLLARANMTEVLKDFGRATKQEDPVVHFYETFLAAYDPKMRQTRGVYYTPEPVVSYIVRSLDHIVRTRFNRHLGLADTNTFILDPALGTATFLYFVIQQIHETLTAMGQAGAWNDYVKNHLLPRVFGFELLMAPYAVAHMKLGVLLQEMGYDFTGDQRLGIYLTNSLEEATTRAETLGFAGFITDEANAAAEVKRDKPIMVVLGNPPYSVSSANKGEHIERLMQRYKVAVRDEQNIQPLSDDYIKFLRFAHDRIERTGYGVVGMITNHSYLSGLIYRGMREELMKSFSEIYILNLHGSAMLGETTPDGGKDENVFDIRQGVAIAIFARTPDHDGPPQVHYADLWGLREWKCRYLLENNISTTGWQRIDQIPPYFFFVPKEIDLQKEYQKGWSIVDVFPSCKNGVQTGHDQFAVDSDKGKLNERLDLFFDRHVSNERIQDQYQLADKAGWSLSAERKRAFEEGMNPDLLVPYFYRLFDLRWIYFSKRVIKRPVYEIMRHLSKENKALVICRQQVQPGFRHIFVTRHIGDGNAISLRSREWNYYCPLYLYSGLQGTQGRPLFRTREITREPNLSRKFVAAVKENLDLEFVPDGKGDLETTFGPEDIFHYAYAIFHSPTYRERYAESLRIDFPRLPLTPDRDLFRTLADTGEELVTLHLLESPALNQLITSFPVADPNDVVKARYEEPRQDENGRQVPGRVYINERQYFEGIEPHVWEFQIGGYQVLDKWLKDRKGRSLSFDDLFHYQKIVVVLYETIRLMEEIDQAIPGWPIQ